MTAVFSALNDAGVRYVVVGDLAVLAHGVLRATSDIDIVLDLEESNVGRATEALSALGFQPLIPVPLADLGVCVFGRATAEHVAEEVTMSIPRTKHFVSELERKDLLSASEQQLRCPGGCQPS